MRQSPSQLLDFFSRSLISFESSADPFRVLSTLPFSHQDSRASQPPGVRKCGGGGGKTILVLDSSFNPPTKAHERMARLAMRWAQQQQQQRQQKQQKQWRLMLLLAVNNADKEAKPASFPQRLGMMDRFARMLLEECEQEEEESVDIDLAVTKLPYFSDKARAILQSREYAHHPTPPSNPATAAAGLEETELVFLVGFDTITRIFDAKYYASSGGMRASLGPFFQHARLRVLSRPDDDDQAGSKAQQEEYVRALEGDLTRMGGDAAWAGKIDLEDGCVSEEEVEVEVEMGGVSSSRVREMVKTGRMDNLTGLVDEGVREWIEREGLYR